MHLQRQFLKYQKMTHQFTQTPPLICQQTARCNAPPEHSNIPEYSMKRRLNAF